MRRVVLVESVQKRVDMSEEEYERIVAGKPGGALEDYVRRHGRVIEREVLDLIEEDDPDESWMEAHTLAPAEVGG